jgi:hypothetical protein
MPSETQILGQAVDTLCMKLVYHVTALDDFL